MTNTGLRHRRLVAMLRWAVSACFVMTTSLLATIGVYEATFGRGSTGLAAPVGGVYGLCMLALATPTGALLRGAYYLDEPVRKGHQDAPLGRFLAVLTLLLLAIGTVADALQPYVDRSLTMMALGFVAAAPGVIAWPHRQLADWAYAALDDADVTSPHHGPHRTPAVRSSEG